MSQDGALTGRALIAEGREALVYEWDDGSVLRLMRSPDASADVLRSTAASEAARRAGVRTARVLETIEVGGLPAQVLERVDGPDLFAHMAANPLRLPRTSSILAEVHTGLHTVRAPEALPSTREHLTGRLERSPLVPEPIRARAMELLDGLPDGEIICHGDFHPGNVLLGTDGPVLIDWTGATRGDPTADLARSLMMLRVGELPPGAPATVRALAGLARGALLRLYERGYRSRRPVDPEQLAAWTTVRAADRLSEDIVEERAALLEMVRPPGT